jgi:hypothetical protein
MSIEYLRGLVVLPSPTNSKSLFSLGWGGLTKNILIPLYTYSRHTPGKKTNDPYLIFHVSAVVQRLERVDLLLHKHHMVKPIKKHHLHGGIFVLLFIFVSTTLKLHHMHQKSSMMNQEGQTFMLPLTQTKTPLGPSVTSNNRGVDQQSMMNIVLGKMKRLDLLHGTFFFEQHPASSFLNNNMNVD